jgi:hypothetical protein
LAVLAAATISPCQDPALALRCPDLVMAPPTSLSVARSPSGRRVILRMANRIVNIGPGPLEVFGQRSGPETMAVSQVITSATGRRLRFPTLGSLQWTAVPTRGGDYWKFHDAARFELWSLDEFGRRTALVRVGPKLNYCLRDLFRRRSWPGVPWRAVYPACNQSYYKQAVTLGISVGWADGYPATYPNNWIDITGLTGCFAIVQRADPDNVIFETRDANNASSLVVRLPYRPGPQRCP